MGHDICKAMSKEFDKVFPCPHSNLRIKMGGSKYNVFINKAEGARMWDIDGKEYIDYMAAMGPNILGHRHPEFVEALQTFLQEQSIVIGSGAFCSPEDVIVGEKIVRHSPCAEKVKLCVTGSDAVQMAIRLARAYTRRPYFIRFENQYHGWPDNVLGGSIDPSPAGKPFPVYDLSDFFASIKITGGMSPGAKEESFILPWNNLEVLEQTLETYGREIALIHFEALVCNEFCMMPRPGFLEKIRELCTSYGIVMSFDEVITGFRIGLNGAQGYFNVTPDLATYGKALAGGFPVSAVAGKRDIMDLLKAGEVLGPGTFNGFPMGMRAARTTLEILERDKGAVYSELARLQTRLTTGFLEIANRHGVPLFIQGAPGVFFTLFGIERDPDIPIYTMHDLKTLDFMKTAAFYAGMIRKGVASISDGRWHLSIAHTDRDIDQTLELANEVMKTLQ